MRLPTTKACHRGDSHVVDPLMCTSYYNGLSSFTMQILTQQLVYSISFMICMHAICIGYTSFLFPFSSLFPRFLPHLPLGHFWLSHCQYSTFHLDIDLFLCFYVLYSVVPHVITTLYAVHSILFIRPAFKCH